MICLLDFYCNSRPKLEKWYLLQAFLTQFLFQNFSLSNHVNHYNCDNGHCRQLNSRRAESQELRSARFSFAIFPRRYPWIPCEQYANVGLDIDVVDINRRSAIAIRWYLLIWERLLQRLESKHQRSFTCVYIFEVPSTCAMGLNNQHTTYQGSRVTITISITGWQLELGPAGKLCSDSLELYIVVEIMCSKCDFCLGHNVQCPLIRFQAKLMCCIFPLRRQLCTQEEEKWVVSLNLKLCAVYIVCAWEVESRVSVIVVVRVGKGTTTLHALTSWAGKNVDGRN